MAPRCLCGLPAHCPPDPQDHCPECGGLFRGQARGGGHARRPARVRDQTAHLRPARLLERRLPGLRPGLRQWPPALRHRGFVRAAQRSGYLLQGHPAAAPRGTAESLVPLCGQGSRPGDDGRRAEPDGRLSLQCLLLQAAEPGRDQIPDAAVHLPGLRLPR